MKMQCMCPLYIQEAVVPYCRRCSSTRQQLRRMTVLLCGEVVVSHVIDYPGQLVEYRVLLHVPSSTSTSLTNLDSLTILEQPPLVGVCSKNTYTLPSPIVCKWSTSLAYVEHHSCPSVHYAPIMVKMDPSKLVSPQNIFYRKLWTPIEKFAPPPRDEIMQTLEHISLAKFEPVA